MIFCPASFQAASVKLAFCLLTTLLAASCSPNFTGTATPNPVLHVVAEQRDDLPTYVTVIEPPSPKELIVFDGRRAAGLAVKGIADFEKARAFADQFCATRGKIVPEMLDDGDPYYDPASQEWWFYGACS